MKKLQNMKNLKYIKKKKTKSKRTSDLVVVKNICGLSRTIIRSRKVVPQTNPYPPCTTIVVVEYASPDSFLVN